MCDQTEVVYTEGDVVWVKLGPVWWPGEVHDYDKLPEEITSNLRKRPIAVVKFFQEESYEYVKNLNQIYHYNCRKKNEFIKKGLDMCRSNNREVPSNMKMFPKDIVTAEHRTNGNPDILDEEEFKPEEKEDYSDLFGKKTPRKGKNESFKKDMPSWRVRALAESSQKKRNTLSPSTVPRQITHPRFISKAREGRSDHEVRIRQQTSPVSGEDKDEETTTNKYNCHLCGFAASRINVMIYHNKSHTAGYADAFMRKPEKAKKKSLPRLSYGTEKRPRLYEKPAPAETSLVKKKTPKISTSNSTPKKSDTPISKSTDAANTSVKKPIFGKKKTAKEKAEQLAKEKEQNDAFRETLLKDWDFEDDDGKGDDTEKTEEDSKTDDSTEDSKNEESKSEEEKKSEKPKKTSCFDFDDSEDGLDMREAVMTFGRKIPRVLGDKPKKRRSSFEETEDSEIPTESEKSEEKVVDEEVKGVMPEKEKAKLDLQFQSLLEETSVPVIPSISVSEKKNVEKEETIVATSPEKDDYEHNQEKLEKDIEEELILDDVVDGDENKVAATNEKEDALEKEKNKEPHFLVKTSEEEATPSSDVPASDVVDTTSVNNVAPGSERSNVVEETVQVSPVKSHINDIVNDFISETPSEDEAVVKTETVHLESSMKAEVPEVVVKDETNSFQEMDFDINSMPVIIGDETIVHGSEVSSQVAVSPVLKAGVKEGKVITVKPTKKTPEKPLIIKKEISKDTKSIARKVLLSPTKAGPASQVTTIKVPTGASPASSKLTMPGLVAQKGATSQVLILKSATPGQPGKSTLTKIGNASQVIQQAGGKVLILTNPQGGSQGKVLTTLAAQQKGVSPTKLTGTRILTTKGTVLTTPGAQQTVISKANILSSGKTVTTKSGQKILINKTGVVSQTPKSVIINKSNVLTPTCTVVSKATPHSILTTTPSKVLNSALTTSKGMILTPVSKGVALGNNQKLRVISSKAQTTTGAKLMIQSTPSRVILPSSLQQKSPQLKLVSNIKGQNTGTILIQTSQGVLATTPMQKNVTKVMQKVPVSIPQKTVQIAQTVQPVQSQVVLQKVRPSGPNILQKQQRKPTQRGANKKTLLATTSVPAPIQTVRTTATVSAVSTSLALPSTSQDTLILQSGSGLPVLGRSGATDPNQTLVYLTMDESGNYRPLETTPVMNYEAGNTSTDSQQQTLYIDPGTGDLDNIFLAIDESGNVVNISQPVQNITTENTTPNRPSQDILAKALANTQVLQQETIATENTATSSVDSSLLGCMFVEQQPAQYPAPTLSHSVLETSLTLNQPIMTPLEVPSAVSPRSLEQITTLPSTFLSDSTLLTTGKGTTQSKVQNPSMPLLTEESDASKNETVFLTQVSVDGSTVLTPVSTGSHLFQFALDENNVIVSSSSEVPTLINTTDIPQSSISYLPTETIEEKPAMEEPFLEKPMDSVVVSNTVDMPSIVDYETQDVKVFPKTNGIDQVTEESIVTSEETLSSNVEACELDDSVKASAELKEEIVSSPKRHLDDPEGGDSLIKKLKLEER